MISKLLLVLLAVGCTKSTQTDRPLPEAELSAYQTCSADTDCVYAQNGSCDCNNFGEAVAINRAKLSQFRAQFADEPCFKRGGPDCKAGRASCVNKMCQWSAAATEVAPPEEPVSLATPASKTKK